VRFKILVVRVRRLLMCEVWDFLPRGGGSGSKV
jgi:hypothetical protein